MQVYRRKTLIGENVDFVEFAKLYADAVVTGSVDPFLLIRHDESRLLIVTDDGSVMLCHAYSPCDCFISYASSYSDGTREFVGLSGSYHAKDECFVDPTFAINAIHAFFEQAEMSDHVDFRRGSADSEITTFPKMITARQRVERTVVELRVQVSSELQTDMREVREYLDEVAGDPDVNIDYDDAIQIGSLCGGRLNHRQDVYLFSYHHNNGDVWSFKAPRTVLDGIADGTIDKLNVTASIPQNVANTSLNPSDVPPVW